MRKPIDYETVKRLIERAIEEKGEDYICPKASGSIYSHFYFDGGKPSCIVGHVLHYLDITPDQVKEGETIEAQECVIFKDFRSRRLLGRVQAYQDQGQTWGTAYRQALSDLVDEDGKG